MKRNCSECGKELDAKRRDALTCSARCRMARSRRLERAREAEMDTLGPEYEPEHLRRQTYCARMIRCDCLDIDGECGRDHCWTCGRIMVTRPSRTPGNTITEHAGPSVAERLATLEIQREAMSGNAG